MTHATSTLTRSSGAPRRLWRAAAAVLAAPAVILGAWAWTAFGGQVEQLRADERRRAESAVAAVARRWEQSVGEGGGVALRRGDGAWAPFIAVSTPASDGAAARIAMATMVEDAAAALPFFAHAVAQDGLGVRGHIAWARCLWQVGDRERAHSVVDALRGLRPATEAGVSAKFAAALLRAEWAAAAGDDSAAQELWTDLAQVRLRLGAAATLAGIAALEELAPPPDPVAVADLAAAARVAGAFDRGELQPPQVPRMLPDGSLLVPREDRRWDVWSSARVERVWGECIAGVAPQHLGFTFDSSSGAVALRAVQPGNRVVGVRPDGVPASERWGQLQGALLLAAGLAFVLGNGLLVRVVRREVRASRARAELLDLVSHELRTPLAALSLRTEMLAQGVVSPAKQADYHRSVHGDVQRLATLVERVLDAARAERIAVPAAQPVPVRTLVARGVRAARDATRLAGQRLSLQVPRDLPAVHADAEVLARALRNLLENAAKYCPAGSAIDVRAELRDGELRLTVADRGPGIPTGERERVFVPFQRGSTAPSSISGSGLGLALVQSAARQHGGQVEVEDREGGGAVFTLRLPAERGA